VERGVTSTHHEEERLLRLQLVVAVAGIHIVEVEVVVALAGARKVGE